MKKKTLVILAAGRGTRLLPLTATCPKPLLKVYNKHLIEYTLSHILPYISDIVFVVGYLGDQFEHAFGKSYHGVPISYVHQEDQSGTAHAVYTAQDACKSDDIFCIYGDDIYGKEHFEALLEVKNGIIGKHHDNWNAMGVIAQDKGNLEVIVEKPDTYISDLVHIGVMTFQQDFFRYYEKIGKSMRDEFELTDMLTLYAEDVDVSVIESNALWMPMGYPWNLLDAASHFADTIPHEHHGIVEEGAVLRGNVYLGENSIIKSGCYLEGNITIGENCVIGPNCYIRNFASIGDNCRIGNAVEIKGSIVGDGSSIAHFAYLPDSILGNGVNYAAGTVTADLKHDGSNVRSKIGSRMIDTGRRKFGTVIGDNARIGINTSIFPGRKIWNNQTTLPGELVSDDII